MPDCGLWFLCILSLGLSGLYNATPYRVPHNDNSKIVDLSLHQLQLYTPEITDMSHTRLIKEILPESVIQERSKEFLLFSKELHASMKNDLMQPLISEFTSMNSNDPLYSKTQNVASKLSVSFQNVANKQIDEWQKNKFEWLVQTHKSLWEDSHQYVQKQ